jgi:methionyl-tRNA formyltransferase
VKLVLCGTPEFAVPTLGAVLEAGHEVALVLTQPDRPSGRKLELQAPPVKRLAEARGLPVMQPEKIKTNPELRTRLEEIRPDAILVVAYGRIIPGWMLELPRFGNINLHGSLLPKYRGAAPIQWAVANGETETGVTTMLLDAGLDTGDVLLERRFPIGPETMASELFAQLAPIGAELMVETLGELEAGTLIPKPQEHERATLARILRREDGLMDLEHRTAAEAYNRWRGFYPWPGAYAQFRGKRLLVHRMHPLESSEERVPAGELRVSGAGLLLAGAADGAALVLDEVQPEGKPRLAGPVFAKDYQVRTGERLG